MNGAAGAERPLRVAVHPYGHGEPAEETNRGYRLQTERKWVVEGDDHALTQIANQLPSAKRTRAGANALILNLVNSVGVLNLPHLGEVELVTGKFDTDQFDAMLRELTELATTSTLPFSAGEAAAGRYSVSTAPRDDVLYHAFVYLRYILSDRAPERVRLLPALEMIVREPHRLWRSDRRDVRIEAMTRVDAHTPLDLVTRPGTAVVASSLSPSGARLAERLGRRLPEVVSERKIRPTTDTPENRFVKAFIGQARTIIGRMRSAVSARRPDAFRRNLLRDCDRMEASLMPIARHSMWEEVGRMVRIPFSSTVLQRRRGYRRVLQHFSRIRLAPMIPLDKDRMRDLLELKNIALLYELWTFFRLVHEISAVLGRPPVRSGRLTSGPFQTDFAAGGTFDWDPGVRLVYNQRFSRSRSRQRHSYSVPLIPDIALRVPDGPNAGLYLFDAKFRVRALPDVGLADDEKDADDEKAAERAGSFKRADIYKMHAYRDAIPEARSVWILYPGGKFRFYGVTGGRGLDGGRGVAAAGGVAGGGGGVG
ncbi:MAG: DUF2357 domain-containing protein, partial [Gemmatimonadetes bacterium]|nr:DUF2357 domain-containing protein [Gemmatimonadota bacterium]